MATVFDSIDGKLTSWMLAQPVYFIGTAPLAADGHINLSPKGMAGTFAVLSERRVAYLDYTGSGAETIAHLRDNGRVTLMFCAFTGPPNIVRLYGRGTTLLPGQPGFDEVYRSFDVDTDHGVRAVIVVDARNTSIITTAPAASSFCVVSAGRK